MGVALTLATPVNHHSGGSLPEILQHYQLLQAQEITDAIVAARAQGQPLIDYVLEQTSVESPVLQQACAEATGCAMISLLDVDLSACPVDELGVEFIQQQHCLPLPRRGSVLPIAISDPGQLALAQALQFQLSGEIEFVIADHRDLQKRINHWVCEDYYQQCHSADTIDAPVLLERLFDHAIQRQVSDIHIESAELQYRVRFRIDGLLQTVWQGPQAHSRALISRVKILASLDIAEQRLPQDGRFQFIGQRGYRRDCRVSCCPSLWGEHVVIRLLNPSQRIVGLAELGMLASQQLCFESVLQRPQGLVIVTGPTGSGKTVTLYSALQLLNESHRHIMSVEDPVEIQLAGITQVNVRQAIGLDFATVLRSFLRQDPDVMMVGEIRDKETADIAIRAAQTGHLVLSTLHTNSAVESVTRLLNLGVHPVNLASALSLVIAQRLLRRCCPLCQAVGCAHCHDGYQGRQAVFELLSVNAELQNAIVENNRVKNKSAIIKKLANQAGMISLWQAGEQLVNEKVTTKKELYRVIGDV